MDLASIFGYLLGGSFALALLVALLAAAAVMIRNLIESFRR